MDNCESAHLRGDEASKELAAELYLGDEIQAIQNGIDTGKGDAEPRDFQIIERVAIERGEISDRVQQMIENGELPEGNLRLQRRRDLKIEILASAMVINQKNRARERNSRIRASGRLGVNIRDTNLKIDSLLRFRNMKRLPEKVSFGFKGKRIVLVFSEKINVFVNNEIQDTFGALPIGIAHDICFYNSL